MENEPEISQYGQISANLELRLLATPINDGHICGGGGAIFSAVAVKRERKYIINGLLNWGKQLSYIMETDLGEGDRDA
jgi:hypothetical protein|tara:strand:- start:490 stop:723 length:234 start_codon:yes stop_codon:yes gene_type:complete